MTQQKELTVVVDTPCLTMWTPYLLRSLGEGRIDARDQMLFYGLAPTKLSDMRELTTPHWRVKFATETQKDLQDVACVIAGMDQRSERLVRASMSTGLIVARYSIFHPESCASKGCGVPDGSSIYTGSTPEEAGYSLSIPKDVATVRELLTYEPFLAAIAVRDADAIEHAVEQFSAGKSIEDSVIATPFLRKALSIPLRGSAL